MVTIKNMVLPKNCSVCRFYGVYMGKGCDVGYCSAQNAKIVGYDRAKNKCPLE